MPLKYKNLQASLGYTFQNIALLQQALTHRSYSAKHNERFEFLGDSLLNCIVAEMLFNRFETLKEGELSRLRAQLVRQDALQAIAEQLELGKCLRLGEGELKSGGSQRPSILADALEAIFAAIFLDAGFSAVSAVIQNLYRQQIAELNLKNSFKDPKTDLQEWLQAKHLALPRYELVNAVGPAHAQEFEVKCSVDVLNISLSARGGSRRIAEQAAALLVLEKLNHDTAK